MVSVPTDRDACVRADAADPLAMARERFDLPAGIVYLDGNSLGPLPRGVAARVAATVEREWGAGLVRSWNEAGWIDLPRRIARRLAPLVGVDAARIAVADTTSTNLFKALGAAVVLRPDRGVVLTVEENFPSDLYVAGSLATFRGGGLEVRAVPSAGLFAALDETVAVVTASHVDFRTGELLPLAELTARAEATGALAVWDVAHSAGALPLALDAWRVPFAVGCGYKFLNGGPGAPAFLTVRDDLATIAASPIAAWLGHAAPFAFADTYQPGPGAIRFEGATPPVISMVALDEALGTFEGIDPADLRAKGIALVELFLARVERELPELGIAGPRDPRRRGSQVSLRHPEAFPVMQALIGRGVIGDFREPDILRFGLSPLVNRYVDVWDAVDALVAVIASRSWDDPALRRRGAVT